MDPAQSLTTAGEELDGVGHDLMYMIYLICARRAISGGKICRDRRLLTPYLLPGRFFTWNTPPVRRDRWWFFGDWPLICHLCERGET